MRTLFVRIAAVTGVIGAAFVAHRALNPQPLPPGHEQEQAVAPARDTGAPAAPDASASDR